MSLDSWPGITVSYYLSPWLIYPSCYADPNDRLFFSTLVPYPIWQRNISLIFFLACWCVRMLVQLLTPLLTKWLPSSVLSQAWFAKNFTAPCTFFWKLILFHTDTPGSISYRICLSVFLLQELLLASFVHDSSFFPSVTQIWTLHCLWRMDFRFAPTR